jgi:hypothetical protein
MADRASIPLLSQAQTSPGQQLHQHGMFAIHSGKMTLAVFLDGLPLSRLILRETVEADLMNTECERSEGEQEDEPQLRLSEKSAVAGFVYGHCA